MAYTFSLKDSVTLPLTPELIAEFATMAGSITERPKDDKRAAYIRSRIEAGLAVTFGWAKAQVKGEKTWYRVNGQHSSGELQELQALGLLPEGLVAHVDSYVVPDKPSLVQLFRQFDPRQSSRTPLEVTNAYASVSDELNGISRKVIKLAAEGIWWYRKHVVAEQDVATGDDRYAIVMEEQYHPFIKWLDRIMSIKTPEIKLPHVVAAAWATYQTTAANATEFWEQVAGTMPGGVDDEAAVVANGDPVEPGEVLDAYLVKAREGIYDIKPHDAYQGCIYAWNAYVDEKTITKVSAPNWRTKGFLDPKFPAESEKQIAAE